MKALFATALLAGSLLLTALGCSRQRVESLNRMNEGVVLAARRQYPQAAEMLGSATAVDPTNAEAFWNLAIVHMEMQKFQLARDDLQRAIDVDPDVAGYHEKLGTVLMEIEDWEGAQRALGRAIELDDSLFKAYFKLGRVHERVDNPQEALRSYTEAIQRGPRFIPGYRALGRLYADLRYLDEAVQVLQAGLQVVIEGTEDEAHLHNLLGTVYQQRREFDPAVAEFQAALALLPGLQDTLFSLGWTYALQDNREDARRYLKRYTDQAGPDAPAHYLSAARSKLAELGEP